jgi:transposase-like protein
MQISSRVRKRLTAAQRHKILRAYERSQLTQKQFAAEVGIGVSTLHAWLRKAAATRGGGGSGFLPVPNLLSASPVAPTYRIHWPDGLRLEVRAGFVDQELAALLRVLRAV